MKDGRDRKQRKQVWVIGWWQGREWVDAKEQEGEKE